MTLRTAFVGILFGAAVAAAGTAHAIAIGISEDNWRGGPVRDTWTTPFANALDVLPGAQALQYRSTRLVLPRTGRSAASQMSLGTRFTTKTQAAPGIPRTRLQQAARSPTLASLRLRRDWPVRGSGQGEGAIPTGPAPSGDQPGTGVVTPGGNQIQPGELPPTAAELGPDASLEEDAMPPDDVLPLADEEGETEDPTGSGTPDPYEPPDSITELLGDPARLLGDPARLLGGPAGMQPSLPVAPPVAGVASVDPVVRAVPEPASVALLALGAVIVLLARRRGTGV